MMDTITIDPESAIRRTLALRDCMDQTRRAASAAAAAGAGEPDALREAVLQGIRQRLASLLAQLQALDA